MEWGAIAVTYPPTDIMVQVENQFAFVPPFFEAFLFDGAWRMRSNRK